MEKFNDLNRILLGVSEKHVSFAQHIDRQTNVLISLSTGVFVLVASHILRTGDSSFKLIIPLIFSAISGVLSLYAIHPPKFMRKRGQKESLLVYSKKIASFKNPGTYVRELKKVLNDENKDRLIEEIGTDIYNITKYYYRPKRKLFVYARNVFMSGIITSTLLFLFA
ncbi:MAG: hypothetical protein PHX25_01455 [Candidatus Pacebacteria bacterium]|nr:hypothetical protein [Candidatus Paceibacterota bacterium]